jgi:hypothetical protein
MKILMTRILLLLTVAGGAGAACGGSTPESQSSKGGASSPASAAPVAATPAPAPTNDFDRPAAAKAIAAVDVKPCYDKPPLLDAPLHLTITINSNGVVEASADRPYGGTEAGNCAIALFNKVRVAPWLGVPKQMGRTVPRAPVRGSAADAPFDPSAARTTAAAQDLSDCADLFGNATRTKATIRVEPTGIVSSVLLDSPMGTSPRGDCVARIMKGVMYTPYSGEPAAPITVDLEVKKKK